MNYYDFRVHPVHQ